MCFFARLNSLDVQIQVYFTLRTVTVVSHVFDMLSGVSLSFAKKRVNKSTSCYSSCLNLSMTRTTNNLLTCQLVNSEQVLTCET